MWVATRGVQNNFILAFGSRISMQTALNEVEVMFLRERLQNILSRDIS
jgi:hypothetical protein